jgi:hypothetical protein
MKKSSEICLEISKIAVSNFISDIDEQKILEKMIQSLVSKMYTMKDLVFLVCPSQEEQTKLAIKKGLQGMLSSSDYKVKGDSKISEDCVRVVCSSGAFVEISRKNLIQVFSQELEAFSDYFHEELSPELATGIMGGDKKNAALQENEEAL